MSMWTLFFFAVCAVVLPTNCGAASVRPKIVGPGRMEVAPNEYPWLAFILKKSTMEYITAGILIKPRVVLTLGYNYYDRVIEPHEIHVVLGAHNRSKVEEGTQTIDVTGIQIHPELVTSWQSGRTGDLSLIQLATPATTGKKIKIFPLRLINSDPSLDNKLARNGECVTMGWGRIKDTLFETILPKTPRKYVPQMQSFKSCTEYATNNGFQLPSRNWLCSINADKTETRPGDGGNPLVCSSSGGEVLLHGLVAGGTPGFEPQGFTAFTRLATYRTWITKNAKALDASSDAERVRVVDWWSLTN